MQVFLLSLVMYMIYLFLKTKKSLHMLQQNRYNRGNKYLKWIGDNLEKNFLNLEIILLIFPMFYNMENQTLGVLFNTLYFIFIGRFLFQSKHEHTKVPLNYTGRLKRLYFTSIFIYVLVIVISSFLIQEKTIFYLYFLSILMYFNNLVVVLANIINIPIENMVNNHFKKKAQNKLKSLSNLDVIGITGSYGKTSSKNILNDVLNVKFNCLPTPKNYNTPTGLMITVNEYLDKFNDYFIAEMGACKTKEIKELCDLVHPKYGILTKIGVAHLETFGSQENIQKTKFELIESLPKDGIGILNADDKLQVSYKLQNHVRIIWIGIDNTSKADVYADNIRLSKDGTTFDCHFKEDNKTITLTTKLLGKANIYNILAAVALGEALGLTKEELELGVKKVNPVEHRLELKRYYDMYLIDDAYNANPDGAKMALDVLNLMPGKKIIITSGMIELGEKSEELNKELGRTIADVVDIAILIGEKQTKPIQDGLLEKKFDRQNIIIFNDIQESFSYLQKIKEKDAYILLQSDLPDIFNEK